MVSGKVGSIHSRSFIFTGKTELVRTGALGLQKRVHNIPDEQRNPEGPHHLNVPESVIGNSPTYSDISTSITGARPAKLVPGVNGYSTLPTESAY